VRLWALWGSVLIVGVDSRIVRAHFSFA
jgi:hypothetical protein